MGQGKIKAKGALAVGLSTAAGLLVAGASAVAHDWYSTVFRPNSNDKQILKVGRLFTIVLCVIVVLLALNPPALIAQVAAMVFAVAANTLTPGIVLGIWYSKANIYGTLASMSFGLAGTLVCIVGWVAKVPFFGSSGLLPATSSALILCPVAFLINIVVSNLMAEKVSKETRDSTDAIMRKLHNLPGAVYEEPDKVSAFAH